MPPKYTWSYSSLSLFQQCPKKYYHLKVAKEIKEPETEAILYGKELHSAAENYIGKGTPIPPQFSFIQPYLDKLKALGDNYLCEYRMGLTRNLEPCDFFAPDVWWRGVADLIIPKGDMAFSVDYKTGKSSRYADTKQLEIISLAISRHMPEIKKVKAGLLFVVAGEFVKVEHDLSKADELWMRWFSDTAQLEKAYEADVWNARPNFTCQKYCPVLTCPHNGRSR